MTHIHPCYFGATLPGSVPKLLENRKSEIGNPTVIIKYATASSGVAQYRYESLGKKLKPSSLDTPFQENIHDFQR